MAKHYLMKVLVKHKMLLYNLIKVNAKVKNLIKLYSKREFQSSTVQEWTRWLSCFFSILLQSKDRMVLLHTFQKKQSNNDRSKSEQSLTHEYRHYYFSSSFTYLNRMMHLPLTCKFLTVYFYYSWWWSNMWCCSRGCREGKKSICWMKEMTFTAITFNGTVSPVFCKQGISN